jgi:hypothetical protein
MFNVNIYFYENIIIYDSFMIINSKENVKFKIQQSKQIMYALTNIY